MTGISTIPDVVLDHLAHRCARGAEFAWRAGSYALVMAATGGEWAKIFGWFYFDQLRDLAHWIGAF